MLVQFLVENFLSFKDETVFSMKAPPGETHAVDIPGHDGLRLMRAAAFYGANASGKSNLVKALQSARQLVARGALPDTRLPARAFRLLPDGRLHPTRFQFDFLAEGALYSYTLIITTDQIAGEALYRTLPDASSEELVYEREVPKEGGDHVITLGPMMQSSSEDQQFARFVAKGAPIQQPLLTEFTTRNVPGFAPILDWFRKGLSIVGPSTTFKGLLGQLSESGALRKFYGHMLLAMGTGIRGVKILKEQDPELSRLIRVYEEARRDPKAAEVIRSLSRSARPNHGIQVEGSGDDASLLRLSLEHETRSGSTVDFSFTDESDGTRRLLHLLPVLFYYSRSKCTIIDELDRSLHTSLTRRFVEEFMAMASGALSQLIFTTHDTNLLNGRLLPPASIWFVEKDDDGASHLHSLAEYPPTQLNHLLEHLEEGYLQGRFGAIPFLAHRDNLSWQAEEPAK